MRASSNTRLNQVWLRARGMRVMARPKARSRHLAHAVPMEAVRAEITRRMDRPATVSGCQYTVLRLLLTDMRTPCASGSSRASAFADSRPGRAAGASSVHTTQHHRKLLAINSRCHADGLRHSHRAYNASDAKHVILKTNHCRILVFMGRGAWSPAAASRPSDLTSVRGTSAHRGLPRVATEPSSKPRRPPSPRESPITIVLRPPRSRPLRWT